MNDYIMENQDVYDQEESEWESSRRAARRIARQYREYESEEENYEFI